MSDLVVGHFIERTQVVSGAQVRQFAEATGDFNPVHLDEAFAVRTRFGGCIAHGLLVAGFVSTALAAEMPGPGTIYLSQTLRFLRPVRPGDAVTVRLEVLDVLAEGQRARISTVVRNQRGEVVVDGEALVMLPSASHLR